MADSSFTKIPKFLRRLYREVSDISNPNIVWSNNGETLRIPNKEVFIKETLPVLSRTKEYSAFIRQLNIYGFVKVKGDDTEEYCNNFFKRNQPSLMNFIKRVRRYRKVDAQLQLPSIENSVRFLTETNYRLGNEVSALKERVEKQERTINGLLDIFGRVFRSGMQNFTYEPNQPSSRNENIYRNGNEHLVLPTKGLELFGQLTSKETDKTEEKDEIVPKDDFADMNDIFF